jgi:hypothetical protein
VVSLPRRGTNCCSSRKCGAEIHLRKEEFGKMCGGFVGGIGNVCAEGCAVKRGGLIALQPLPARGMACSFGNSMSAPRAAPEIIARDACVRRGVARILFWRRDGASYPSDTTCMCALYARETGSRLCVARRRETSRLPN